MQSSTKPETSPQRRRFFRKLIFFVFTLGFACLPLVGSAFVIGEALPPALVLALPNDAPGVYQPTGPRETMIAFKVQAALQRRPDVLLLASSRGYHLRSAMFTRQPDAFYNGSFSSASIGELRQTVEVLAENGAMPDVLLLGLDLPDFNGERVRFRTRDDVFPTVPTWQDELGQMQAGVRTVVRNWVTDPKRTWTHTRYNLASEWPLWGFPVWQRRRGFLMDGSQYNSRLVSNVIGQQTASHLQDLRERDNMYEAGATVDEESIGHVARVLQIASDHGTEVIGFWPSYLDAIAEEVTTHTDYAYVPLVQSRLTQTFEAHGYSLHDYTVLGSVGATNAEMYDGWHGGEMLMAHTLLALTTAEPAILGQYVDVQELRQVIAEAEEPFYIYVPRLP